MWRRRDERHARLGVPQLRDLRRDLVTGKLAAFARFGALRDLDLQLVREREVLRGDAEARRCDLLDRRVALGSEARGVLASLAGVRACAEAVEGDRDRLVSFGRKRTV